MLATIKRHITKIPFLLVLAIASLLSLTAQTLAYAGTNNLSLWSGTSGWNTLWSGTTGTFTLAYGETTTTTTTPTTPTPISTSIAQDLPIVFGIILIIAMFITAITTRSVSAVITATIICLLGIFGIVLLENLILSIFGK